MQRSPDLHMRDVKVLRATEGHTPLPSELPDIHERPGELGRGRGGASAGLGATRAGPHSKSEPRLGKGRQKPMR